MKKMFWMILILALIVVVSGLAYIKNNDINKPSGTNEINEFNKGNENLPVQKFTFGPNINEAEVSEETKRELQEHINALGEVEKDNISFNGFSAKFREDGALVLSVFVRNGYSYSVYDIDAKVDIKKNGEVIASANFNLTEKDFGVLNAKESRVWNLVYENEHILNKNVELKEYVLEYSTKFNKK
ncbi:SLAP domain-containing protein [Clostridium sp.]|uniref:SLAP domain-containing protein n=1 Tax=Clostridium sp. TaxID=1506 RepID=UPI002FC992E2